MLRAGLVRLLRPSSTPRFSPAVRAMTVDAARPAVPAADKIICLGKK
jgi:hypothetical protein